MRKRISALFLLLVLLISGCGNKEEKEDETLTDKPISEAIFMEYEGYNHIVTYREDDKKELDIIANAIKTAEKQDGIPKMLEPDYVLKLHFTDRTEAKFNLWFDSGNNYITEEGKSLLFKIPESEINNLKEIIN